MAKEYGMTPEEFYWVDRYRGSEFSGPTPEELLEVSEEDFLIVDYGMDGLLTNWANSIDRAYLNISDPRCPGGGHLRVESDNRTGEA